MSSSRSFFAGEEAWIVGGAIRDEALGRPVTDLDVACRDAEARGPQVRDALGRRAVPALGAARRVAGRPERRADGRLHARFRARSRTTSRPGTSRINAIARAVGTGETVDPFDGRDDLAATSIRAVRESVFADDPLRLLRAVRLEDELPRLPDGPGDRGARAP